MSHTIRRPAALALAGAALLAGASGARADLSPQQAYSVIKQQEHQLEQKVPVLPSVTDGVGVFVSSSGTFAPYFSTEPEKPHGLPALHFTDVGDVNLRFNFTDHAGPITLKVNQTTYTVAAHHLQQDVPIGRRNYVNFRVTYKGHSAGFPFLARRTLHPRAGVFTLGLLPVAVLYEPPQPPGGPAPGTLSSASYTDETSLGTRLTLGFGTSTETTTPPTFDDLTQLAMAMKRLGGNLAESKDPRAQVAGGVLSAIAGTLGSVKIQTSDVTTDVRTHALEVSLSQGFGCSTVEGQGPGRGDVLVYLQGARIAYLFDGEKTQVALIGADRRVCKAADKLQALAGSGGDGLSAADVGALLALDPFSRGPALQPGPASRFAAEPQFEVDGAVGTLNRSETVSSEDTHETAQSLVTTTDFEKGLASAVGIGPSATDTVKSTVTASSAASYRQGHTISVNATIYGPITLNVYFDRLFGAYAMQVPGSGIVPPIARFPRR